MVVGRQAGSGARAKAAGPWALLAALLLGGCETLKPVNPVLIYNRISGRDDAQRPAPPGMDRPTPSLGSVPPRPVRPPPEVRNALSDALAVDRANSREPVVIRQATGPAAAASAGDPLVPAAPPARARLAGAPAIPWGGPPALPRSGPAAAGPTPAEPAAPEISDAPPEAPPAELLGPPPAPRL